MSNIVTKYIILYNVIIIIAIIGRGRRSAPAVSTGAGRGARARPDLAPTDGLVGRNLAQLRDEVRAESELLEIRRRQLNEEFEQMQRAAELAAVEVRRAAAEAAAHEAATREEATQRAAAEAADREAAAREEATRRAAAEAADREAAAREEAALQVVGRQNQEPNNNRQGGAAPPTAEQFEKLRRVCNFKF